MVLDETIKLNKPVYKIQNMGKITSLHLQFHVDSIISNKILKTIKVTIKISKVER